MNIFNVDRKKPFSHTGRHGTQLFATQCDLLGKNVLTVNEDTSDRELVEDMTDIIGWWCVNIRSNFIDDGEGHPGLDAIKYEILYIYV